MNTWIANACSKPTAHAHSILIARNSIALVTMLFATLTCGAQQNRQPVSSLARIRSTNAPVRSVTISRSANSSATSVARPIVIPGANHPFTNDAVKMQPTTPAIEHGKVRVPLTSSSPVLIEIAPTTREKSATPKLSIARIDLAGPPESEQSYSPFLPSEDSEDRMPSVSNGQPKQPLL